MTTSHSNSGALSRYILFGPKEEEADHSRYGPLAQFAKLEGEAAITIQKRKERKNAFSHVGGYSTVKILMNKGAHLKAKLNVNQTFVEVVGEDDEGNPKEKRTTKVVDAGEPTIETYNKLKVYTWKLKDTTSIAKMYLSGNAEIYAIAADGAYGVAVDNVAMRGSSGTIFHRIDSELLAESYKAMNARLIIMEYGGNLVPGTNSGNIEWTKKIITRQIQAIQKANPDADILFIGPADMARQKDGQWQTYAGLNMTIKALREVALDNGAAYWDMHRVMGGNGSMIKWVNKEPALGFTDHIHFTRRGAAYMGDLFCAALRMHYDYFKFRDRHHISDEKLKDIHEWKKQAKEESK
jgi:lysophospholipase L1-like esterase